jgi:hypothetical protein
VLLSVPDSDMVDIAVDMPGSEKLAYSYEKQQVIA